MNHEKLNCYRNLLILAEDLSREVRAGWGAQYGYLADQMRRAISSALLNLAEGNAKSYPKERRRFFQISLGSLAETAACLDLALVFKLSTQTNVQGFKERLISTYRQITKLP